MSKIKNKTGQRGRKRHGLSSQTKALAAFALADKVGYLQVKDFPDASLFDGLPARAYGPHKVIRCKPNELLLVTRGVVEVWHKQHDLLVKQLVTGVLFGEMPLLGQTMIVTHARQKSHGEPTINAVRCANFLNPSRQSAFVSWFPILPVIL